MFSLVSRKFLAMRNIALYSVHIFRKWKLVWIFLWNLELCISRPYCIYFDELNHTYLPKNMYLYFWANALRKLTFQEMRSVFTAWWGQMKSRNPAIFKHFFHTDSVTQIVRPNFCRTLLHILKDLPLGYRPNYCPRMFFQVLRKLLYIKNYPNLSIFLFFFIEEY